ncbi:MAG: hypothetical protein KBB11_05195 [Bacteroidales bacterium]|nr:hypothetical protein [Bacteroidales bacterium]HOY39036.1 hypothetical protein [Bacteroidales bacterium]HQP04130.1 hypothetical protein [Bacteroidales bacterium]
MLNKLIFVLFLITAAYLAEAQNSSPYSRYGLGDLNSRSFGPSRAMGGTAAAFSSGRNLNVVNPASIASVDSMCFIFEFGLESGIRYFKTTNPDLSALSNDTKLSYLAFGFPVTRWWASSIGIMPFSSVGYSIRSSDSTFNVPKYYYYEGSGGINQVYWGNAFLPFRNFRIGVNAYYLFGMQNRSNSVIFSDDSGAYVNVLEENIVYVNDFCFSAGLQYDFALGSKSKLSLGAVFSYPNNLNSRRDVLVTNSLSVGSSSTVDTIYNEDNQRGTVSMPLSAGGGLLYNFDDKLKLAFDYNMQNWSDAKFFNQSDSLGNSNCFRFGAEYLPAGPSRATSKYSQRVAYRFGAFYNNTYINFATYGEQIADFGISFGFGLPLNRSKTSFNISIELGQRGTTRNSLVRETYANLGVNLTLSDVWFIKRKFD